MGGCMSSPAAETSTTSTRPQTKQVPSTSVTAPQSTSAHNTHNTSPASPGDGTPTSAQGMAQALAMLEPPSPENRGSRDRSNAIDRQLEDDSRKFKKECKILLLGDSRALFERTRDRELIRAGSGESGKSTIVKQMKIIHQNGYSKEELATFRMIVYVLFALSGSAYADLAVTKTSLTLHKR